MKLKFFLLFIRDRADADRPAEQKARDEHGQLEARADRAD